MRPQSLLAATLLLGLGCPGPDPSADPNEEMPTSGSDSGDEESASDDTTADTATFYRDALPIFARACNGCHRPDGAGPFDLTDADAAAPWAEAIVLSTQARAMPPLTIDASGACNTFENAAWLTDEELATLASWAEDGAPAGDPNEAPDDLGTTMPGLDDATHEVAMTTAFSPEPGGPDDYRCFVLDSPTPTDAMVTGYEVRPGDARIVHHVILYASTSAESDAQAEAKAAEDPEPGYECFGAAGIDDFAFVAGWAPGTGATHFPEGTGLPLGGGRRLIMQVHYFPRPEAIRDRTSVALALTDAVDLPAQVFPAADLEMELQPGREREETVFEFVNERDHDVAVYGMYPHMHKLGRTLKFERLGATDECIIDVPRWDFDDQRFFFLESRMVFHPGETFRLTCGYDTRDRDAPVTWGEGTNDEMCLLGFYFADL